jgi:hypothetical protein
LSAREGKGRDRERRTIKEKKNSAVVPWTADGAKQKLLSLSQKKTRLACSSERSQRGDQSQRGDEAHGWWKGKNELKVGGGGGIRAKRRNKTCKL